MDHHPISDVFVLRHKKNALLSRFRRKERLPVHVPIFFFVLLALTVGLFTLPSSANAQSTPSTFQPSRSSIYGTFYYPWYKNKSVDGTWSYWQDSSHSPPNSWFSNYLPLRPGAYDPATGAYNMAAGLYSSRDKDTFYWQINMMAQAKLEIAISSWWGRSTSTTSDDAGPYAVEGKSDFTFRKIVTDWMNQTDNPYPNLRWTPYYEKEGAANPSVAEIAADLTYLNNNYANQPSFFKVNGRPVIFAYGDASDKCAMVDRWLQARAQSGTNFYIVLKLFSGYTSCASQPDSWHEYAPASRSGNYATDASFISPGFWKVGDSTARLPRNLTEFDAAATGMVSAKTKWKLVQTWNEWGEGTSVEPGVQVQQTVSGAAKIASSGLPFEDKYIQVMSQRFPSLQAGTGVGGVIQQVPTAVPTSVPATSVPTTSGPAIFVILMENHNWKEIKGSKSAPYLNGLLTQGAHAEAYFNPPGLHPSEPNYIWLEAGTNFGVKDDANPSSNHQSSTAHLTTLLGAAGISWKSYQEDISGTVCPLTGTGKYAPKHNPMIFFDDVTGTNNPKSANCIAHNRPYTELAGDLTKGTVARYNFITPNLCNDMHDSSGCASSDSIKNGDNWLKQAIPPILASSAYKNGGIVFITWDEGEGGDGPIGLIALSSTAKIGYSNTIHYTHSSLLRTVQEFFGVKPLLGDAAKATNLSDLFTTFPGSSPVATIPASTATKTAVLPTKTPLPVGTPTPGGSVGGRPIIVSIAEDAYVNSDSPTTNFGNSLAIRTDASPTTRSYLRFNVPTLSGSVTQALLEVYANTAASIGYSVSGTTGNWTEKTINFSNAPTFGGGVGNSGPIKANTWTTVDVTALVKGAGQYNFVMATTNNTATSLVSKEGAADKRPQLIITTGSGISIASLTTQVATQPPPTEVIPTIAATETATIDPAAMLISATNTLPAPTISEPTVISVTPIPASPTLNGPTLTIEMNPANAAVGSTVSAVLKLNNMSNLYGLQAECKVDPTILNGSGHTEGNIFTGSNSFVVDPGYQPDGHWSIASSLLNPAPAFSGDGAAFNLNYQVLNVGHTTVECTALAVDTDGNLLPISVVNGDFDNTQAPAPTGVPTDVSPVVPTELPPAIPTEVPPVVPTDIPTEVIPTDVPLPTEAPTAEATLPATPGTVSGIVKYEKHPDQTGIDITLLQNGTAIEQGQTNADGSFQFNDVPAGQYEVQITAEGYLTASMSANVPAGEGATIQVTLLAGDLDKNGLVDVADAGLIGANYGIQAPPAPAEADLNGDGFVNLVDLVLVGKNFGKTAQ